ncbi:MAG: ABC transporter ATP-binding protein [Limisphaerales bacterium]|mgnify:FL=1|jgi:ATP-binding cassette subfamily B protein|nr:ABC transporter ATP-binding protein [Verrucomicrobiota bacterium]
MRWNLNRVLLLYRSQAGAILFALLLLLLGTAVSILKPWPVAFLLDSVLGDKGVPVWMEGWGSRIVELSLQWQVILCAASIFLIHLLSSGLGSLQNYVVIRIGLKGLRKIRKQVFSWLQHLSQSYFLRQKQGDVIYRVCWDTYSFQTLFQHVWFSSAASFIAMLSMLWVMWHVNQTLTVVSCFTLPMLFLGIRVYGGEMSRRSREAHRADSLVASYIQQTVASIAAIQSFAQQKRVAERFEDYNRDAWSRRLLQHAAEILYQTTVAVIFSGGMAAIIWAGAREVMADRLTVGELVVFITYLSQFYEPLQKLILAGSTLADSRAGVERVFEVLDTRPEIVSPASEKVLAPVASPEHVTEAGYSVGFEGVSFGYEPERLVLKNLSFQLKPGEFVGLVGPSGAGKSTLAQLICRFFDPQSGVVRLGGIDARQWDLNTLRRSVSVVHQEPLLLPGSIRENILFGRENASEEEMLAVSHQVHAHDFITRLPKGYDTEVGDGQCRISMGEMQRICLARALLKESPILILDEPTSSLDAENQRFIMDGLERLAQSRTTLMIAHRLSTLTRAARILVLVDGEIQAVGSHEQLLEQSEYYRRAVESAQRPLNAGGVAGDF